MTKLANRGVTGWRAPARGGRWQRSAAEGEPSPFIDERTALRAYRLKTKENSLYTFVPLKYQMLTLVMSKQVLSLLSVYAFVV